MTIASKQFTAIGAKTYAPQAFGSTIGAFPGPDAALGETAWGDAGACYMFVKYAPVSAITLNQGDVMVFDSAFLAVPSKLGAAYHSMGSMVGTVYFGGRSGDPASNVSGQGNIWSYAFLAATTYGLWLQVGGASVANYTTITSQADLSYTTATINSVSALASGATNSQTITGMFPALQSFTFTASAASGATLMTCTDTNKLEVGMVLSGTSVPNGTYIKDIQGGSLTLSAATTGLISAASITAKKGTTWGTTVSGSAAITGVGSILGVYPNATLTGTGVSGTVGSITGIPGNYIINMTAASAVTGSATVSLAATQYVETILNAPFLSAQN